MRARTALMLLACVGLVMSFTLVQAKTKVQDEDPSTIKKMAAQLADYFVKDKDKAEAMKDGNWWDKLKVSAGAAIHATKHRDEKDDDDDDDQDEIEKSWVQKLNFWGKDDEDEDIKAKEKAKEKAKKEKDDVDKSKWLGRLMFWKLFQKTKESKDKEDDKSWIDSVKFWKSKDEEEEGEGFSFKNWAETFKFWEKSSMEKKVDAKADELKEKVKETDKKIQRAISKQKKGINKIMKEVHLPKIDEFPDAIKDIKLENIKFKQCIHSLKPALPGLMSFGYHASRDHSTRAVSSLFKVLKRLPNISRYCLGEEIRLTETEVDDKKCVKDIVALTELASGLATHPWNLIGEYKRMKKLVNLVPLCISHCTTAFEVEKI